MSAVPNERPFDASKAEAFAGRLLSTLNHGGVCLMASIGHRTGLFDALRDLPPSTFAQIAEKVGLHERYVREWLGAMATAGVVEVDSTSTHFCLPPEHAAFLTRAAGADNMAVFFQWIPVLAGVEEEIVECFRRGGGVPYERFRRFHAVMAEDSGQSVLSALESHVLPLVPGLAGRLEVGIRVLDAGCGSGRIVNRLAELYPKSRFTGIDLSAEAIAIARAEAARKGLLNVEFVVRDLSGFDRTAEPEAFDLVTSFDAIHDQAHPLSVLKGIHRTLADDGVYLMQDIRGSGRVHGDLDHPIGPFLLCHLDDALHDGVARPGRRGAGDDVGRAEGARVPGAGGLPLGRDEAPGARRPEQLVRGAEVSGPMIEVQAVRELYRYNRWANGRTFDAVSTLTPEQFARDLGASHPSLRDTLTHVVWAESIWLQRWTGSSPRTVLQASEFPRPDALRARWAEVEAQQRVFVEAVTPERLASIVRYVNLQGETWQYPLWRQMYHLVNHSTYHRGQVAAMLRQVGARPHATDFLVFQDELESRGLQGSDL
jgi:uncharacterized damage-inducible protein DinB